MDNKLSDLDVLTLQLMCSKSKYNKFISKTNPEEHSKKVQHANKVKKYAKNILRIVNEYIYDENAQITNELDDAFEQFIKKCIRHIEIQKINEETNGGCYEEDYKDEVLFENGEDEDCDDCENEEIIDETSCRVDEFSNIKKSGYNWGANPNLSQYIEYTKKNKK